MLFHEGILLYLAGFDSGSLFGEDNQGKQELPKNYKFFQSLL